MAAAIHREQDNSNAYADESPANGNNDHQALFANTHFRLSSKIGTGSFGDVYQGIDLTTMNYVAIKLEHQEVRSPQLENEAKIYKMLNKAKVNGFPRVHWYGYCGQGYNALAMELLGPTLEDMFNYNGQKLALKSVLMVALQMIDRVHQLHRRLYVHRDLKPSNFIFGRGCDNKKLFLTDLGLAKRYRDLKTLKHIDAGDPKTDKKPFVGSLRFSSINNQLGYGQSRRDDMESIGYILIYLLKGRLPWQGIKSLTKEQKHEKVLQKKQNTPVSLLCRGFPHEFTTYMEHVRKLKFDEDPDYDMYLDLFRSLMQSQKFDFDYRYDWLEQFERARENRAKAAGH